ncbi:hypothetical protein [Hymenobacter koreensis]|uniref:Phosphatase PAP2 family protein n=1 Tax=Hymenobacter koreensis TaxID=1084523 RepID=A0ABP8J411_9BACT
MLRTTNATLLRLAAWVSGLGHPLLTAVVFVVIMTFYLLDARTATWIAGGVVIGVILPIALWNYRQTRTGAYSNFDVSVREQRRSFYPRLIGLLATATALTVVLPTAAALRNGMGLVCLMLVACFAVNFYLKVSLHAAWSFFLASAVYLMHPGWGIVALSAAGLIAASRLVLGRHTVAELVVGAAIGLATGGVLSRMFG